MLSLLATLLPALAAGPGGRGVAVPLYAVSQPCGDPRFPTLAGPWVVGCGRDGTVDRALSLLTGRVVDLPVAFTSPGTAPGALFQPGRTLGLVLLAEEGARRVEGVAVVHQEAVAPAATDGAHVAVLSKENVQAFVATERQRFLYDAHPAGWYPPALVWPRVAWVEDAGEHGEDVWWLDTSARADAAPLAGGPGNQRHVVASEGWLAWVEPDAVAILAPGSSEPTRYPARTGFSAPITLWEGVACWEDREGPDIDLHCSDGVSVTGPGHQRWPARWDRWLLYREGDRVMLYTAP